ncbi:hypothetical protein, variant [Blastomyces dermatitidis ER-3]|uniref:Only prolin and serin are matching in the corresponding protein n=2 Tax=Ajellomyces dermatitidis TaxID=5039 RepID=F2TT51_AJEDA|nr:uncharacterized protein BDCG_02965 [Blastomyces dermatitidis ER-3]XP_045280247.1 hypothetical protein, variant [Blastomyces dermatitidis ER-3]EGE86414.1 only prolin and serin are matching in the corresponding protein [Blastomyces dermatitidis ATCC 18188]EQL29118.1 hypothetical protein BDFG_08205 [Blastomyces dermatitidis ATCC 26199]EQL29119.1 hypothetical protein, variant [Blastomyces dermatitidis ATCC 26199]KMW68992.1 only prolin and serin are matching in the corresponding protein, variant
MVLLSQLFETDRRECSERSMESSQPPPYASPSPQSPQSVASSNPGSPAVSLFSARAHNRFPSSASSLASSPGLGSLTEGYSTMKTPLTDVKEDPLELDTSLVDGSPYFAHFNQVHADDGYSAVLEYDLSDDVVEKPSSPKKRKSDGSTATSFRGISRLSNRFTSMSSKWKHKQGIDTAVLEKYDESLRSRANSATSTLVSPTVSSLSIRQGHTSPSPARTAFEDRLHESGIHPIDIDMANRQGIIDTEPKATTPLLPPLMVNLPNRDNISPTQSPLQSPSVADVTDSNSHPNTTHNSLDASRATCLPSPPLSKQASVSSISRQLAGARTQVQDLSPVAMPETDDEWSDKLGHANFTIRPEPYLPTSRTLEAFEEHRNNWELARCNYAKHLTRIAEHYGATSNIYRLTEEKWDSVEAGWRGNHNELVAGLEDGRGNPVSLLHKPDISSVEAIKIPQLDDKSKFPDRGDEDIVGPMSVAPVLQRSSYPSGKSLRKRTFFKFLQDLFTPGIKA